MESPTNPDNFVRIAQRIRHYGALIFPNFVKFTVFWVTRPTLAPMIVKFGVESTKIDGRRRVI